LPSEAKALPESVLSLGEPDGFIDHVAMWQRRCAWINCGLCDV